MARTSRIRIVITVAALVLVGIGSWTMGSNHGYQTGYHRGAADMFADDGWWLKVYQGREFSRLDECGPPR